MKNVKKQVNVFYPGTKTTDYSFTSRKGLVDGEMGYFVSGGKNNHFENVFFPADSWEEFLEDWGQETELIDGKDYEVL